MDRGFWYDLDPDHNKREPSKGMFCCRCKRPIKQTQCFESFISVEMHPVHYWVKISTLGRHLLGSECSKKLNKKSDAEVKKYAQT